MFIAWDLKYNPTFKRKRRCIYRSFLCSYVLKEHDYAVFVFQSQSSTNFKKATAKTG